MAYASYIYIYLNNCSKGHLFSTKILKANTYLEKERQKVDKKLERESKKTL